MQVHDDGRGPCGQRIQADPLDVDPSGKMPLATCLGLSVILDNNDDEEDGTPFVPKSAGQWRLESRE